MLTREAAGTIYTHAGPEIGVASTKAFTSQITALVLLAIKLGLARGTLSAPDADGQMAGSAWPVEPAFDARRSFPLVFGPASGLNPR